MLQPSNDAGRIALVHESAPYGDVVHVMGDVDFATAPLFGAAIAQAVNGGRAVFVDLSSAAYLDSSGLSELIRARRTSADMTLIVRPATGIERVLRLCNFEKLFSILAMPPETATGAARWTSGTTRLQAV